MEDFIQKFAALFEDADTSIFDANTRFHEVDEWCSLLGLQTMAMVSEEYDVQLRADDIRNAITIQDLYNTIQSKVNV